MNPIEFLAASSGTWTGSNTLQDPHSGKPEASESTATLTPVLGDRFVRVDYTWDYQGKPQEGSLLIGHDPKSAEVSGHWIDTWHMGRKVLSCVGTATDEGTIAVLGSWAAPPGPDWGWRITIGKENGALRITHTVIDAEGEESLAAEGLYPLA